MSRLFSLFPHERGPIEPMRGIALGTLWEWSTLWTNDPRFLSSVGLGELDLLHSGHPRLRYFAAGDLAYPNVPLRGMNPGEMPRRPTSTSIRDKVWQRLVVEDMGHISQPRFAIVNGSRVEACNAPWRVHVELLDCRPVANQLRSAVVPGVLLVVEGVETGFAAVAHGDEVRVVSQNPHVTRRLDMSTDCIISMSQWSQFIADLCERPLPLNITKTPYSPTADLGEALLDCPGSYILKPRFGSNGFCVARVVSHPDSRLTVESDCPDTSLYLEEFPLDPNLRGRDLVLAAATQRSRFIDRAKVGLFEQTLDWSILEEEIRQDRAEGSIFEPRIVVQRVRNSGEESFAPLGAICKRIDTAVGASVARDFREEPLECPSAGSLVRESQPATSPIESNSPIAKSSR